MRSLPLLATAVTLAVASGAHAANTCGMFITQEYVAGPPFAVPGDVLRVRLTLGAGSIVGGTHATVRKVRFDLDCDESSPLGVSCLDEGAIVQYEGDATITTNCGTVLATNPSHAISALPNQLEFASSPAITIPPNMPEFCSLEFDVRVLARSVDLVPERIAQVSGFDVAQNDAGCDNGLASAGSQSSAILLCPSCDDDDPCTDDSCNQTTGACESICPTTTMSSTTTSTTTSSTTTTLSGCAPADSRALKCETAIAKAAAQLIKSAVNCALADARALVGSIPPVELSADGDACEEEAAGKFDAAVAKITLKKKCPPETQANAVAVREGALAQVRAMTNLIFVCPSDRGP